MLEVKHHMSIKNLLPKIRNNKNIKIILRNKKKEKHHQRKKNE